MTLKFEELNPPAVTISAPHLISEKITILIMDLLQILIMVYAGSGTEYKVG